MTQGKEKIYIIRIKTQIYDVARKILLVFEYLIDRWT